MQKIPDTYKQWYKWWSSICSLEGQRKKHLSLLISILFTNFVSLLKQLRKRRNNYIMKEECLICQAPLEYLETETLMECALCHRSDSNNQCIGKRCPFHPSQSIPQSWKYWYFVPETDAEAKWLTASCNNWNLRSKSIQPAFVRPVKFIPWLFRGWKK